MGDLRYVITDVFATKRYSGNQLATVFLDGVMPDEEMQQVAAEFGFSETTFVIEQESSDGAYPVRIFTPVAELPFAGHPALGTAFVLQHHRAGPLGDRITLDMKVGPIPVWRHGADDTGETMWMQQNSPVFEDGMDPAVMASVLGLHVEDVDSRWPISQVSTGVPFTIVPLVNRESLKRACINRECFAAWSPSVRGKGILVFSPGGYTDGQDFAVRVFVPHLGITEDPATGSANGCLAAYLVHHRCLGRSSIDVRIGQGYEMGRPSEVRFCASLGAGESWSIEVGGRVIEIASGMLRTND